MKYKNWVVQYADGTVEVVKFNSPVTKLRAEKDMIGCKEVVALMPSAFQD